MSAIRGMRNVIVMATLGVLAGCARPGTLAGITIDPRAVPRQPQTTIVVSSVTDARGKTEHEGVEWGVSSWVFFLISESAERKGNFVTNDFEVSPHAGDELRDVATAAISTTGVANVVPGGPAEFELRIRIEHLYATSYAGASQTEFLGMFGTTSDKNFGPYGNAVFEATLFDHRSGKAVAVWSEHVTGFAEATPGATDPTREALRKATRDAVRNVVERLAGALDRLHVGPQERPASLTASQTPPAQFVIERMGRYRDLLERDYVSTATGVVTHRDVVPPPDRYASRPGDWLLSRTTADGATLSDEAYESTARSLARTFDLRRVDDAVHYHFFGLKGTAAPIAAAQAMR